MANDEGCGRAAGRPFLIPPGRGATQAAPLFSMKTELKKLEKMLIRMKTELKKLEKMLIRMKTELKKLEKMLIREGSIQREE